MGNIKEQLKEQGFIDLIGYTQKQFVISEDNYLRIFSRGEQEFIKGIINLGVYEIRDGFLIKADSASPKRKELNKKDVPISTTTNEAREKEISKLNKIIQTQLVKLGEKNQLLKDLEDKIKEIQKTDNSLNNTTDDYSKKRYDELRQEKHKYEVLSMDQEGEISALKADKKRLVVQIEIMKAEFDSIPKSEKQKEEEEVRKQQDSGRLNAL